MMPRDGCQSSVGNGGAMQEVSFRAASSQGQNVDEYRSSKLSKTSCNETDVDNKCGDDAEQQGVKISMEPSIKAMSLGKTLLNRPSKTLGISVSVGRATSNGGSAKNVLTPASWKQTTTTENKIQKIGGDVEESAVKKSRNKMDEEAFPDLLKSAEQVKMQAQKEKERQKKVKEARKDTHSNDMSKRVVGLQQLFELDYEEYQFMYKGELEDDLEEEDRKKGDNEKDGNASYVDANMNMRLLAAIRESLLFGEYGCRMPFLELGTASPPPTAPSTPPSIPPSQHHPMSPSLQPLQRPSPPAPPPPPAVASSGDARQPWRLRSNQHTPYTPAQGEETAGILSRIPPPPPPPPHYSGELSSNKRMINADETTRGGEQARLRHLSKGRPNKILTDADERNNILSNNDAVYDAETTEDVKDEESQYTHSHEDVSKLIRSGMDAADSIYGVSQQGVSTEDKGDSMNTKYANTTKEGLDGRRVSSRPRYRFGSILSKLMQERQDDDAAREVTTPPDVTKNATPEEKKMEALETSELVDEVISPAMSCPTAGDSHESLIECDNEYDGIYGAGSTSSLDVPYTSTSKNLHKDVSFKNLCSASFPSTYGTPELNEKSDVQRWSASTGVTTAVDVASTNRTSLIDGDVVQSVSSNSNMKSPSNAFPSFKTVLNLRSPQLSNDVKSNLNNNVKECTSKSEEIDEGVEMKGLQNVWMEGMVDDKRVEGGVEMNYECEGIDGARRDEEGVGVVDVGVMEVKGVMVEDVMGDMRCSNTEGVDVEHESQQLMRGVVEVEGGVSLEVGKEEGSRGGTSKGVDMTFSRQLDEEDGVREEVEKGSWRPSTGSGGGSRARGWRRVSVVNEERGEVSTSMEGVSGTSRRTSMQASTVETGGGDRRMNISKTRGGKGGYDRGEYRRKGRQEVSAHESTVQSEWRLVTESVEDTSRGEKNRMVDVIQNERVMVQEVECMTGGSKVKSVQSASPLNSREEVSDKQLHGGNRRRKSNANRGVRKRGSSKQMGWREVEGEGQSSVNEDGGSNKISQGNEGEGKERSRGGRGGHGKEEKMADKKFDTKDRYAALTKSSQKDEKQMVQDSEIRSSAEGVPLSSEFHSPSHSCCDVTSPSLKEPRKTPVDNRMKSSAHSFKPESSSDMIERPPTVDTPSPSVSTGVTHFNSKTLQTEAGRVLHDQQYGIRNIKHTPTSMHFPLRDTTPNNELSMHIPLQQGGGMQQPSMNTYVNNASRYSLKTHLPMEHPQEPSFNVPSNHPSTAAPYSFWNGFNTNSTVAPEILAIWNRDTHGVKPQHMHSQMLTGNREGSYTFGEGDKARYKGGGMQSMTSSAASNARPIASQTAVAGAYAMPSFSLMQEYTPSNSPVIFTQPVPHHHGASMEGSFPDLVGTKGRPTPVNEELVTHYRYTPLPHQVATQPSQVVAQQPHLSQPMHHSMVDQTSINSPKSISPPHQRSPVQQLPPPHQPIQTIRPPHVPSYAYSNSSASPFARDEASRYVFKETHYTPGVSTMAANNSGGIPNDSNAVHAASTIPSKSTSLDKNRKGGTPPMKGNCSAAAVSAGKHFNTQHNNGVEDQTVTDVTSTINDVGGTATACDGMNEGGMANNRKTAGTVQSGKEGSRLFVGQRGGHAGRQKNNRHLRSNNATHSSNRKRGEEITTGANRCQSRGANKQ